jgi:GcrA cell cycle regulator
MEMTKDRKLTKEECRIIELWEAGYTGSQIAAELSITRNAVMGKIYRLRRMAKINYGHNVKTDRIPIEVATSPSRKAQPKKLAQVLVLPASMARSFGYAVAKKGPGFTLMELVPGMCKYSISGDHASDYRFCGAKVTRSNYCDHHYSLCYVPPRPRDRSKSNSKPFVFEGRKS